MERLDNYSKRSILGLKTTTVALSAFALPIIASLCILLGEKKHKKVQKAGQQALLLYGILIPADIGLLFLARGTAEAFIGPILFLLITINFWGILLIGYALKRCAYEEVLYIPVITALSNKLFRQPPDIQPEKKPEEKGKQKGTKKRK